MTVGDASSQVPHFHARRVWITGGTSGLGLAAAEAFAALGDACFLMARDAARGARAEAKVRGSTFVPVDVADAASCDGVCAELIVRTGAPDVVVHAAGILVRESLPDTSPASVAAVMGPSVDGAFNVLRRALPAMAAKGGAVVLTSSYLAGRGGSGAMPVYNAAKAALLGLMKSLAVRYGPSNIRVNAVLPAFIETPMNRGVFDGAVDPSAERAAFVARFPLRRLGRPEDFAAATVFLASDAASWITGHGLVLDGGLTA